MLNIIIIIFFIYITIKLSKILINYFSKNLYILCKETDDNNNILNKLGKYIDNYKPTFYLFNFELMVIYHMWNFEKDIKIKSITINSRDNCKLNLDLFGKIFDEKPIIILKYGLNGNSKIKYIRILCKIWEKNNFNVVIINNRSLNEKENTKKLISSHEIYDIEDIIDYVNKKFPNSKKFLLGISLGANEFTKYLGETKIDQKITSACMISNSFDLLRTIYYFDTTLKGKLISNILLYEHKKNLKNNLEWNPNYNEIFEKFKSPLVNLDKINSYFDFNSKVVKRMCGYNSIYDYFSDYQSINSIKNIKIKTLFINSINDEISQKEYIPLKDIYTNDNCILLLSKNGGHIEYFSGIKPKWWAFELSVKYFKQYLK